VHRDVKPSNVLLSLRGEVKLVDFGIAQRTRRHDDEVEGTESLAFGTPAYMSPEQILGDAVDARSDLFSLGVVLYQMLAGARPFEGDDAKDRRASTQRIRRSPATPLRARAPDVPRSLERVVMRLLEKLPADRYASAAAVAEELEEMSRVRVRGSPRGVVARVLRDAGFSKTQAPSGEVTEAEEPPLRPVYLGYAGILALGVAFSLAVELADEGAREAAHAGEAPLELVPHEAAALRVLATPWADVAIDGEHVETTPFARPIPLVPGTHFVTLTHPDAPPEQRAIKLSAGETRTLDVTMALRSSTANDAAIAKVDAGASGGS
jgi:serine/threonine-protein kinase